MTKISRRYEKARHFIQGAQALSIPQNVESSISTACDEEQSHRGLQLKRKDKIPQRQISPRPQLNSHAHGYSDPGPQPHDIPQYSSSWPHVPPQQQSGQGLSQPHYSSQQQDSQGQYQVTPQTYQAQQYTGEPYHQSSTSLQSFPSLPPLQTSSNSQASYSNNPNVHPQHDYQDQQTYFQPKPSSTQFSQNAYPQGYHNISSSPQECSSHQQSHGSLDGHSMISYHSSPPPGPKLCPHGVFDDGR